MLADVSERQFGGLIMSTKSITIDFTLNELEVLRKILDDHEEFVGFRHDDIEKTGREIYFKILDCINCIDLNG
jgi:hypothetical protein